MAENGYKYHWDKNTLKKYDLLYLSKYVIN